jgi:hypothetical protein
VDFKPRHVAVRCCQTGVPNGVPFLAERRKAFNSVSVSPAFTEPIRSLNSIESSQHIPLRILLECNASCVHDLFHLHK